ncbi:MAG: ATP-grasp domain-containing protein [Clostridia bacterium]|nr:ATP-grasp domain-containing protein [Clostridia bacterium]
MNINKKIIPVLLGADLNCYSVARAFHEAFGVTSHAFGRYELGPTKYSKIVKFNSMEKADDPTVLLPVLEAFAKKHEAALLILIGCTDAYADLIIENKEFLSRYYFCSCPRAELAKTLISKEAFYEMCISHGMDFPKTVIVKDSSEINKLSALPFSYPVIVKPSSSIRYWQNPFDGMKKVYKAETPEQATEIANTIFSSGYDDSLIIQDFIPGDDSRMYVLTAYCDQSAKVKMMCLGHVLLEEHTPKGIGNHVAILTEYHDALLQTVRTFLESVGYTGFANFDIKFDTRDGKFKIFEINLRQGRSNYYVTHSGANIAKLLVSDAMDELDEEALIIREPSFWHTVPKKIIYSYIKDEETLKSVKTLVKKGNTASSFFYKYDLRMNPLRFAYVMIHNQRYFKKYKLYP